nr:hypothetical protein BgiMline_031121 [Biomphalaria glabrata]
MFHIIKHSLPCPSPDIGDLICPSTTLFPFSLVNVCDTPTSSTALLHSIHYIYVCFAPPQPASHLNGSVSNSSPSELHSLSVCQKHHTAHSGQINHKKKRSQI